MHSVWAVATNTIKQALRMKTAAVFVVLLIILLPVMGFSTTGDGTLKGRLQTFVSYGLSLTSLLLCLLTIIASTYSLSSDIQQRQIYTVITKPIRRWQLLLGKLLGVVLLDAALLVLFASVIYGITRYMPRFYEAEQDELRQARNEFFTARAGLMPAEADVRKEVEATYKKFEKSGQLPQMFPGYSRKKIMAELTKQKQLEKRAAVVGQELIWEFNGVEIADSEESLFIRYKYAVSVNPPDLQVYGRWLAGDIRQAKYGLRFETPIGNLTRKDSIGNFHEMEFPADVVAKDGYLAIGFLNDPLNDTTVIFPPEGLEVLYKAGSFDANFVRAVLLIMLRLIFLACLGTFAVTFLSFPVAILLCLVIFFTATFSGFVIDSFDYMSDQFSKAYSYTLKPVLRLLPQFDKYNPTKYLISGRLVTWATLARGLGLMVGIKAVLLLLIGLLIFGYREIAKISV
ncbi:MAG: hypothetical protein ACYTEL_10840 [Planctomycetota bacterium]|jgi:hypothetical protein